jgi:ABC-type transport system involved in cytochrome bd biosynthesis fused ATPase/permease subunit
MVLVGSYAEEHTLRQWQALSRMGASFLDAMQGVITLKLFGRSAEAGEKVAAASEEFRKRTMKVLRYAFLSGFVLEFMTAAAFTATPAWKAALPRTEFSRSCPPQREFRRAPGLRNP